MFCFAFSSQPWFLALIGSCIVIMLIFMKCLYSACRRRGKARRHTRRSVLGDSADDGLAGTGGGGNLSDLSALSDYNYTRAHHPGSTAPGTRGGGGRGGDGGTAMLSPQSRGGGPGGYLHDSDGGHSGQGGYGVGHGYGPTATGASGAAGIGGGVGGGAAANAASAHQAAALTGLHMGLALHNDPHYAHAHAAAVASVVSAAAAAPSNGGGQQQQQQQHQQQQQGQQGGVAYYTNIGAHAANNAHGGKNGGAAAAGAGAGAGGYYGPGGVGAGAGALYGLDDQVRALSCAKCYISIIWG